MYLGVNKFVFVGKIAILKMSFQNMKKIKANINQQNIDEWSKYDQTEIESFGDEGDLSRQYILTPTIFSVFGKLAGKSILDAGCGTGYLARKLAKVGADVTAVEPSKSMFNYCKDREAKENLGIQYLQQDVSDLDLNKQFDFAVANMVLQDIPRYQDTLSRCISALKPDGTFIFSIWHPLWEFTNYGHSYFENYSVKQNFGHSYHRTIQQYNDAINNAGSKLKRILEPEPIPEAKDIAELDDDFNRPNFMFFIAKKL